MCSKPEPGMTTRSSGIICNKLETDIGQNHLGPAFKAIRLQSGKKEVTGTTIHKSDRSPCLSEEVTLKSWHEHFISALKHHPSLPSNEPDNEAASTPADTSVSIDEPSVEEVYAAIKRLRNGRAPGPDGILPELRKCAVRPVTHALHSIFLSAWRTKKCPLIGRTKLLSHSARAKAKNLSAPTAVPSHSCQFPGKSLFT